MSQFFIKVGAVNRCIRTTGEYHRIKNWFINCYDCKLNLAYFARV